jgi:hypothetical protein
MADQSLELDIFRDLLEGASLVGQISKDEKTFTTLYNAFRIADARTFQASLNQLGVFARCRYICEWIRSKECVFLCFELCGPPKVIDKPDPRILAQAIVRFTADAGLVKQMAAVLDKRDRAGFGDIVTKLQLGPYCHLFCHWICTIRYRLICRWVCSVEKIPVPNLATELESAGLALRQLLDHKDAFDQAVAASNAGDSDKLGAVLRDTNIAIYCHFICEWFCSWRCALACTTFCVNFPLATIDNQYHEAWQFAVATGQLAQNPTLVQQLSASVASGDATIYSRILTELKLQPYCIQLCHWVCGLRCSRFCFIVCPPPYNHPWFTLVGDFGINADIDPATGLTNKIQNGHGGPGFGFFGGLSLGGLCPKTDPAHAGAAMAYRFLFQDPVVAPTPKPITGPFVSEVLIGSRYTLWNANPLTIQTVRIRGTGTTSPTPPVGPPGPNPPDHYIVPDPNGWVTVDPQAFDDAFNGWLMGFACEVPFPGGDPDTGLTAGTAVPIASQKNGINAAIIFQATRVSTIAAVNGGAPPDYTNPLSKIHINNWPEVSLINLQEFIGPGSCTPLANDLHVLYTADHELLASFSVSITTLAPIVIPPPLTGVGPRGGAGTYFQNITTWPQCSYTAHLATQRRLTTGLLDDPSKDNPLTFCIGKK